MDILHEVRSVARQHRLWDSQTRVIAAVSGGSDSVALFLILHLLHRQRELILDALAHLNHGIRGRDADRDQAFCRALARHYGVALVEARVDVPATARASRTSLEVAARRLRQSFFADVLASRGAAFIATGHTRDDQAETVLLRLIRGTGLRGLGGIAPRRDRLVRPLLTCGRLELQAFLRAQAQDWCEDRTNEDCGNPRNRIRHDLLPRMARYFNPSIADALAALADHARVDAAFLDDQSSAIAADLLDGGEGQVSIRADDLDRLPVAVARRVVRCAFEKLSANLPGPRDVDLVRAVAAGRARSARVGGIGVEHSGGSVVLTARGLSTPAPGFRFALRIPGVLHVPEAGWTLEAAGPFPSSQPMRASGPEQVTIEASRLGSELIVRSRQPGDRLRPLGLGGSKKIQDLFVDRKVNRLERDRVPIVTDSQGRILWVAGHAVAEDVRVTERTNAVVVLKLRRI